MLADDAETAQPGGVRPLPAHGLGRVPGVRGVSGDGGAALSVAVRGVLAASTVCTATRVMCEDGVVAGRLQIRRLDRVGGGGSMATTMAGLMLSGEEEESMVEWGIMPLWKNQVWWRKYRERVARNSIKAFDGLEGEGVVGEV